MSYNRDDFAPDVPFLQGMRVCLNPESPDYRQSNESAQGNAGYVVKCDLTEKNMKEWKSYSTRIRTEMVCRVQWDNGEQSSYYFHTLLHVESNPIDILFVKLTSGSTFFGPVDAVYQQVDNYVLKEGYHVRSTVLYDNAWRSKMLDLLG